MNSFQHSLEKSSRNDYLNTQLPSRNLDSDSRDPYLDRDDPEIQIADYVLDAAGSELGFFCFLMLVCVFFLLNQVDGKIFRLKIFLMNRKFNVMSNERLVRFVNFILRILSWISFVMPLLALVVWTAGLIIRATDFDFVPVGGICVLMVGLALFFFTFGIFQIKWSNYQIQRISCICFLLAFVFLTAYQYIAIFLDKSSNSYFGYSSVFLSSNCLVIIFTIFLNSAIKGGSINDILMNQLEKGEPRDPNRDVDFMDEINKERENEEYFPTYSDIIDLFTIAGSQDNMGSVFGGGLQSVFKSMNKKIRRFVALFLWCFATAILIVYSYVIYWKMEYSRLGFVTMIAVLLTDVFVYLIWHSKVVESTTIVCIATLLNRLLLFVFGGNYWIYGYMLLYLIYGAILSHVITRKRFPFEDAYHNIDLSNINQDNKAQDIAKTPEFLLVFITTIYVILFVVLYVTEPRGVPLLRLNLDNWEYPYYINGVFCLLIIATFFALLGTYRLFIRKKKRIDSRVHFYVKNKKFDMYWIFISVSFLFLTAIGLISYWITKELSYFLVTVFASIFVIAYLNAFLHYVMNDYEILQNVESINYKIRRHNTRVGELRKKVDNIKKELEKGETKVIGSSSLGLAKNIIMQDRLKRKNTIASRKMKQQNEALSAQKASLWKTMNPTTQRNNVNKNQRSNDNTQQKSDENYRNANVDIKVQTSVNNRVAPSQAIETNKSSITPNMNEDERLIEEELAMVRKGNNDDEIYEGGEQESDLESSDEEFDLETVDEDAEQKKQKKRLKQIADWRNEMHWTTAFFRGKLRSNDYQIIYSILIAHVAIVLMAVLVSVDTDSVLGITIAVPFIHYSMAAFALSKHLNTDAKISPLQYFFFFLAYVIQYGWGIANLYISYTRKEADPSYPGSAIAGSYIVVYLMAIPFITSAASAIAKWIDDKGQITPFFLIQITLTALQGIGMLVLAYVYMTYIQGIIVSVVCAALGYIIFQIWIYVKNDYYMPNLWTVINLLIVSCIIIASTVVSLCVEGFRVFTGVSISIWVFAALLLVYALSEITSDLMNMEKKPIYFSPWVFPVYIYNPKKNDVEPHNLPSISLITGLLVLILWSITASVWIYPHNVGISLSILFENVLVIAVLHLIQVSGHQLKNVTQDVDRMLIKKAWLDAKTGYVNTGSAFNRDQLVTYEKMRFRRDCFRNYMRVKEGRSTLNLEEKSENVTLIPDDDIDIEWIDESKVDLTSVNSCYSYLYDLEKEQNRIFMEELELIIMFQLLLVQLAENLQEQKKAYLFTFLNEKKAALFALGIVIHIPDQGSMPVRYARVITQIQKLTPEKQTMFNHLRDHYIQEQRVLDEKRREAERLEEQKERERQEMLEKMSEKKRKLLANVTMDTPVDEMPDCEMKYKKILLEAEQGKVFVDNQFKADDSSLGPNCLNRGVAKWLRARDNPNCVLFKHQDKISHLDVVQGALGDCYFLSAISVLGNEFVRRIIKTTEEEWRKTGAICVQFYKDGEPEIIIIDDFFPAYGNGQWVFAKGGDKGEELWPMVLEKAYAKMYGSYNYIEAGKVQYALSDMTDGFPEQIDLKVEGQNPHQLWENIKTLKRHGSLMGAGSPEHAMGDRAINEMGIVQGHAYAILDIQEVDGYRLLKLRNPHGSQGVEWNGDWSDICEKWDQRMRNKVGYQDSQADGVFWMELLDFIQQFSYLYICRLLDEADGWKEFTVQGKWQGASAEGLPTRQNPNARLDFNPQYAITVTKPCDGFISLTQFDKINMFKGKHSIFFMVSKSNGKRITMVDKTTMLCRSGNPINLNIITAECDFDKSVSYPYTFTLMIANTGHGVDGEGDFEFSLYATDPNVQIKPLPFPEDFPKN